MLVVEGPHDKRVFLDRTLARQQVIVSGGRKLLLAAHQVAQQKNVDRLLFLADCDYDIPLKLLTPAKGMVITEHADLEADLLACGGWNRLISILIPETLDDDDRFEEIVSQVIFRTTALAEVVGRYRRVARVHAFKAETDVRYGKYRTSKDNVDEDKLARALWQNSSDCPLNFADLVAKMNDIDRTYDNCNGHDLVAALSHVLREDFGLRGHDAESLETLLRSSISDRDFAKWSAVQRIHRWEQENGFVLLAR
ncbi:hypothetical protein [Microbispora hainanensis]|uniref:hypothetical protein n=1 Tax=Microbispora hainanensis TaxID=568844 RepID=UPI0033D3CBC9